MFLQTNIHRTLYQCRTFYLMSSSYSKQEARSTLETPKETSTSASKTTQKVKWCLRDPLYFGQVSYDTIPKFGFGEKILGELENQIRLRQNLDDPLQGNPDVVEFFQDAFPELIQWNGIGEYSEWEESKVDILEDQHVNDVKELDKLEKDVYVGGPAALFAAALQSKFGDGSNVIYMHDGKRSVSNWKGSASYFHIRDAIPVYYWPDNHGAYAIYNCKTRFTKKNKS